MDIQPQQTKMSFDAFERLPRRLGWKYEYIDGCAVISPGPLSVATQVAVEIRPVRSPLPLRDVRTSDEDILHAAYAAAFAATSEYWGWNPVDVEQSARTAIAQFFGGDRGAPHPASRLAVDKSPDGKIAGAVLITQRPSGPFLDLLFVHPQWHRQGVATALVASALCVLAESGADHLTSRYHLANGPSRTWHHAFGFVDLPNLWVARAQYRCARHALHYAAPSITPQERTALEQEVTRWQEEVERLERIAEVEGLNAVLKMDDAW